MVSRRVNNNLLRGADYAFLYDVHEKMQITIL